MIVLATEEFATGLRLAGVKKSYSISSRGQVEEILKRVDRKELIIATQKIVAMVPELEEYANLTVFPDSSYDFSNIDDLKLIAKKAIGAEVDL